MTTQEERQDDVLQFATTNAPPELDFLFALARGTQIPVTLWITSVDKKMEVYIDGITTQDVHGGRHYWSIKGRFWGDGKSNWSNFETGRNTLTREVYEYELWGEFAWTYDKRSRQGVLSTRNFKQKTRSLK